jgi:hypothetical protein
VAGHELGEGVGHGDDRLAEVAVLHAGGAPQGAGAGHVAAVGGGAGAVLGHGQSYTFSMGQWLSLPMILIGIWLLWRAYRNNRSEKPML